MAAPKGTEKVPLNYVHKNAILCETILKEQRHQKLYTNYSINPFKKLEKHTGKPNSFHDDGDGEEDADFKQVIKRANQEPVKKYTRPITEAQEIGWITQPLIDSDRNDPRLNFSSKHSAITKYMEEAWRFKEQSENLN